MSLTTASIYWVIVALWSVVLCSVAYFYIRNPKAFGTVRLLLIVIGIDTIRNVFENVYFGVYFGGQFGLFPNWVVGVLGQPSLVIIPKLLNVVAGCVVLGLLLGHWLPTAVKEWQQSELRAEDLKTLAAVDSLTGLSNRRHFGLLAQAEFARSQRYMRPVSLLVIDVDHFKTVNDTFGHEQGDLVLKSVASILAAAKRESDLLARIGGEEFAMLLPETTKESARTLAERLCEMVRGFPLVVGGQAITITISIGAAQATVRTSGIETLFRNADQSLYEAKRAGRDRVVVHTPPVEKIDAAAE